jgi:hypothetical protein
MGAIKDWCVVGRMLISGSDDLDEPLQETIVWEVQHYDKVMYYNKIHYDFTKEEAEAMCKLLNEGG